MKTPCVKICEIHNDQCIGCNRSEEEIARWSQYTEQQRISIMRQLKKRKKSIDR